MLEQLQPQRVFYYFEKICSIPHGSGNTRAMSDYCVSFAEEHKLRYIQDTAGNVILFQGGTPGYESSPTVILQGHLDMVCEKESDCEIDFTRDGLTLMLEDDYVTARGTTLGGDDGIAIAIALAILEDTSIPHPPLEAVFTVDEEVGMLGAAALDYSPLQGRVMLNLDSEDEGILLVSCAGGVTAACHLPIAREAVFAASYSLSVTGLLGGHSGVEIDKGRANAGKVLGRVLYALSRQASLQLLAVEGGLKDNAIPREAHAQFILRTGEVSCEGTSDIHAGNAHTINDTPANADSFDMNTFISDWNETLKKEYESTDPDITLEWAVSGPHTQRVMTGESSKNTITALYLLPNGIQAMSHDIGGLVETSQNLGILKTTDTEVTYGFSTRSSAASRKQELLSRMECLMSQLGGHVTTAGDYPAWEYQKDSPLRELMVSVFEEQYGYAPEIQAIHAGVECGLFAGGLPGLDCVSFGPNMKDIHTPKERLQISSVERIWNYTLEILKRLR